MASDDGPTSAFRTTTHPMEDVSDPSARHPLHAAATVNTTVTVSLVWVVANLTLTGYNPELSNSSWLDKRSIYAASNVSMTRELADIDKFDQFALRERAAKLADRAVQIWPRHLRDDPR